MSICEFLNGTIQIFDLKSLISFRFYLVELKFKLLTFLHKYNCQLKIRFLVNVLKFSFKKISPAKHFNIEHHK